MLSSGTLRTYRTEKRYARYRKKGGTKEANLCLIKPIKKFKYWILIPNEFPYDLRYKTNHMLTPKRSVANKKDLTTEELNEYNTVIADYVDKNYDTILENTWRGRTIKSQYHIHVCVYKKPSNLKTLVVRLIKRVWRKYAESRMSSR